MSNPISKPIDVSDMVAVHSVFRDTLAAAPALIRSSESDAARSAAAASLFDNVLRLLHVHHEGEDALLFPLLRERCPADCALIDRIASQHADVNGLTEQSKSAIAKWRQGDASARDQAGEILAQLGTAMSRHLDEEESQLLPLCAAHVTIPEWSANAEHGAQHFDGDKLWLIFGLIFERLTPEARDQMFVHLPQPVRDMWAQAGERNFLAFIKQIGPPLG